MYQTQKKRQFSWVRSALIASTALGFAVSAQAESGITDKEIVIGSTLPLSGPNAGYGTIGKAQRACYEYIKRNLAASRWAMVRPAR